MSRIVVVGAGIVGLSVARAGLKAGHRVTLLEQGPVPNPRGASHDQHRMIRYHYGAAVGYARMVGSAFRAWDEVWQDVGATHFEDCGAIAISLAPDDYAAKTLATFEALAIPHEVLDREGVERLCPHLTLPEQAWGVVAHPGGPLFADRIVRDLATWVRDHGGEIRDETPVAAIDPEGAAAILRDGSRVEGDHLVVAAGAWLPALMPERFGDVAVWRQALCYVDPPAGTEQGWREAPAIVTIGDGSGYTLPDLRGAGLKVGWGDHRRPGRPDVLGFGSDLETESHAILGAFRPYFRNFEAYRPTRMQVGFYVLDASRRFLVEPVGRSLVVTHCDGQMFKFGPVLGNRIVAMFDGHESVRDLALWAAGR